MEAWTFIFVFYNKEEIALFHFRKESKKSACLKASLSLHEVSHRTENWFLLQWRHFIGRVAAQLSVI